MAFEDYDGEEESSASEKKETHKERLEKYEGWIKELSNPNKYKPNEMVEVHSVRETQELNERGEANKEGGFDIDSEDYSPKEKGFVEFITVAEFVEKLKNEKSGIYSKWKLEGRSW